MEFTLAAISVLIAIGPLLDKVLPDSTKARVADRFLNLGTAGSPRYIAGWAHEIFTQLYAERVLSFRFIVRSISFTTLFTIIGLLFLNLFFADTYYAAISYIESVLYYDAPILPLFVFYLIILAIDYICNVQTQYFLGLMKESKNLGQFSLLAYAELVSTVSLGIAGAGLAVLGFALVGLAGVERDIRFIFDFKNLKEKSELRIKTVSSNIDIIRNESEKSRIEDVYVLSDGRRVWVNGDKYFTTGELLDGYLIPHLSRRIEYAGYADLSEDLESSTLLEICERMSTSPSSRKFRMRIHGNWPEEEMKLACSTGDALEVSLNLSANPEYFDSMWLFSATSGDLVALTIKSVTGGFRDYYSIGLADVMKTRLYWDDAVYMAEDYQLEKMVDEFLQAGWKQRMGGNRIFDRGSLPVSTTFVATLMTSCFIWLVIILMLLMYPAVRIVRKVLESSNVVVNVKNHPFSTLSLIIAGYIAIGSILRVSAS